MRKILSRSFFDQPTLLVSKKLLGKYLVRKIGKKEIALKISEVEAYDGFHDKASHAFKGKTKRTSVMYGESGHFYIYLIYGSYYMLNIVTHKKDYPAAILIRSAGICGGPGKLTKFLKITKSLNGKKAVKKSRLWIEDRGEIITEKNILKTPRIGVNYAGPVWSKKKYRFVLKSTERSRYK